MDSTLTPVLFLIFNRPENTKIVFNAIRKQKPQYLYIAADGPRQGQATDRDLCKATREIVRNVDWPCEVKTLFREHNLGCKLAVSSAITWFFLQVEEGIILEDDCCPDESFFPFCSLLLDRYRTDKRIMSISGSNLLGTTWKKDKYSYFAAHGGIWGWATWRRAWLLYDLEMESWNKPETKLILKKAIGTNSWYNSYFSLFEASFDHSLDTWDIQWFYTILMNGISINPSANLVRNIGFEAGTHMHSADSYLAKLSSSKISFPLKHPSKLTIDKGYLRLLYKVMNPRPGFVVRLFNKLRCYLNPIIKFKS